MRAQLIKWNMLTELIRHYYPVRPTHSSSSSHVFCTLMLCLREEATLILPKGSELVKLNMMTGERSDSSYTTDPREDTELIIKSREFNLLIVGESNSSYTTDPRDDTQLIIKSREFNLLIVEESNSSYTADPREPVELIKPH